MPLPAPPPRPEPNHVRAGEIVFVMHHEDVDALVCCGVGRAARRELTVAVESRGRQARWLDDGKPSFWRRPERQTPDLIEPFVRAETTWLPVGY